MVIQCPSTIVSIKMWSRLLRPSTLGCTGCLYGYALNLGTRLVSLVSLCSIDWRVHLSKESKLNIFPNQIADDPWTVINDCGWMQTRLRRNAGVLYLMGNTIARHEPADVLMACCLRGSRGMRMKTRERGFYWVMTMNHLCNGADKWHSYEDLLKRFNYSLIRLEVDVACS